MKRLVAAQFPKHVLYSSKPLPQGGDVEILSPDELGKKLGFEFTESLFGDPSVLKHILNNSTLYNAIQNRLDLPKEAAVLERLQFPLEDTFVVCDMGPEVGCGLFAKKNIPEGTVLFLYAGEVNQKQLYSAGDNYAFIWGALSYEASTHAVSSWKKGGLARLMQHAPLDHDRQKAHLKKNLLVHCDALTMEKAGIRDVDQYLDQFVASMMSQVSEHELQDICFSNATDRQNIASSNVRPSQVIINNIPVVVCAAEYDIEPNEQLVFSYGVLYWESFGAHPRYFYKDTGALIPTSAYFYPKERDAVATQALIDRATPTNPLSEYNKGIALFKSKEFLEAVQHLNNALALYNAPANKDNVACANCCSTLASCYRELGNMQQAIDCCNQALSLCDKEKNSQLVAQIEKKLAGLKFK